MKINMKIFTIPLFVIPFVLTAVGLIQTVLGKDNCLSFIGATVTMVGAVYLSKRWFFEDEPKEKKGNGEQ